MKKILLAVTAALAITGCSQNEEIEKAGEKAEINFGAVVRNATRATIVNNADFVIMGQLNTEKCTKIILRCTN
mgnify:CR=1 FL=1